MEQKQIKYIGRIEEVLETSEGELRDILETKLREYIKVEYDSPGCLSDCCIRAVLNLTKTYSSLEDIHVRLKDEFSFLWYDTFASQSLSDISSELSRGITESRKSELEECLKVLKGPTWLSGVRW